VENSRFPPQNDLLWRIKALVLGKKICGESRIPLGKKICGEPRFLGKKICGGTQVFALSAHKVLVGSKVAFSLRAPLRA
jgi:hypothetical protein